MRKVLICLLMVAVLLSTVACDALGTTVTPDHSYESGQLGILRTDAKLTQDQVMSQIKAEYLLENNGYKADDKVVVMLTLKDEALIDTYNRRYSDMGSVADYAASAEGVNRHRVFWKIRTDLLLHLKQTDSLKKLSIPTQQS